MISKNPLEDTFEDLCRVAQILVSLRGRNEIGFKLGWCQINPLAEKGVEKAGVAACVGAFRRFEIRDRTGGEEKSKHRPDGI